MATTNFSAPIPGDIEIGSINLTNYDGSETQDVHLLAREFSIYESIWSNHMRADLVLEDALALTTRLPIVGDETVTFQFRTPSEFPNSFTYNWLQAQFQVAKLKNFDILQHRSAAYVMELIPPARFKDLTQAVNIAYGPSTISAMVPQIAQLLGLSGSPASAISSAVSAALSGNVTGAITGAVAAAGSNTNSIEIEATSSQHQFAIPNLSPYETLNFLASEAQSPTYKASNYVFFQTHNKHYFCSIDYLINKTQTIQQYYFFEQSLPLDPAAGGAATSAGTTSGQQTITTNASTGAVSGVLTLQAAGTANGTDFRTMTDLRFRTLFDVEANLMDGLYDNTVYMIDPLLQRFEKIKGGSYDHFMYNQQFGDFKHTSGSTNLALATAGTALGITGGNGAQIIAPNSKLRNLPGMSHQRMLITNKYQDSSYVTYPRKRQDFLPWAVSANAQLKSVLCEFTIPGDSDRCAGDLIFLRFHEVGATNDIIGAVNQYLSGVYLVTSIRHKYTHDAPMPFTTILECVKNCYETSVTHQAVSTANQTPALTATTAVTAPATTPGNATTSSS